MGFIHLDGEQAEHVHDRRPRHRGPRPHQQGVKADRQLDGAVETLDALPEIVAALSGTNLDIIVDGGIRSGTDVVKSLTLGAKMVLLGRPILWGLAVDGEVGARAVLDLLRSEFDTTLALIGCPRAVDLNLDYRTRLRS